MMASRIGESTAYTPTIPLATTTSNETVEYEELFLQRHHVPSSTIRRRFPYAAPQPAPIGITLCYGSMPSSSASTVPAVPNQHLDTDIFVAEIDAAGVAASDGRIRVGDQILQVNGITIHNRRDAIREFAKPLSAIRILLARRREHDNDEEEEEEEDDDDEEDEDENYYDDGALFPTPSQQPPLRGAGKSAGNFSPLSPLMERRSAEDGRHSSGALEKATDSGLSRGTDSDDHEAVHHHRINASTFSTQPPPPPASSSTPRQRSVSPTKARLILDEALEADLAHLRREMETIRLECNRLMERHATANSKKSDNFVALSPTTPSTSREEAIVTASNRRPLDNSGQNSAVKQRTQCGGEAFTTNQCDEATSSSAYNTGGDSCRSTPMNNGNRNNNNSNNNNAGRGSKMDVNVNDPYSAGSGTAAPDRGGIMIRTNEHSSSARITSIVQQCGRQQPQTVHRNDQQQQPAREVRILMRRPIHLNDFDREGVKPRGPATVSARNGSNAVRSLPPESENFYHTIDSTTPTSSTTMVGAPHPPSSQQRPRTAAAAAAASTLPKPASSYERANGLNGRPPEAVQFRLPKLAVNFKTMDERKSSAQQIPVDLQPVVQEPSDLANNRNSYRAGETIYTSADRLAETIAYQQRLLREAMIGEAILLSEAASQSVHQDQHAYPLRSCNAQQIGGSALTNPPSSCVGAWPTKPSNSANPAQFEWKIKRRSDGTRYVTRRPIRTQIMKAREEQVNRERYGMSTDDDAASELKVGRFWRRSERKRHLERARQRKLQNHSRLADERTRRRSCEKRLIQMAQQKQCRKFERNLLDRFTTVQELMAAHCGGAGAAADARRGDTSQQRADRHLAAPGYSILSVTTV